MLLSKIYLRVNSGASRVICKNTAWHVPLQVLASGKAGEVEKAAAVGHMIGLVCQNSVARADEISREVKAICTDLGTESTLANTRVRMSEFVGRWDTLEVQPQRRISEPVHEDLKLAPEPPLADAIEEECLFDLDSASMEMQQCLPSGQDSYLFPSAMPIAGLEHISNNMTKEMHSHLSHWDVYYRQVQNLASLLVRRWRRERFITSCLTGTPLGEYAWKLRNWSANLFEHRWHCARYLGAGGSLDSGKSDVGTSVGGFDPALAEATLSDRLFPVYCRFMLKLEQVPYHLAQWSKGCPCHDFIRIGKKSDKNLALSLHYGNSQACPLAGKRAAEVATDKVQGILEELLGTCVHDALVADHGLQPHQMKVLMVDADAAKAALVCQVVLKMDHWQRLPWLLCGLAHWDQEKVQRTAAKAVEAMQKHAPEAFSSLTAPWMREPLYSDLKAVAAGTLLVPNASMAFRKAVSSLFWVPINESCMKHASASKAARMATNLGPVAVSLSNRWRHLNAKLSESAQSSQFMTSLLKALDLARDPRVAAEKLGLLKHPLVAAALSSDEDMWVREGFQRFRARRRDHLSLALKAAFYRLDLRSMFEDWSAEKVANAQARLLEKGKQEAAANLVLSRCKTSYPHIKRTAMLEHVRSVCSDDSFYSFKLDGTPEEQHDIIMTLQDHFDGNVSTHFEPGTHVFFRVLKSKPSAQKIMVAAPGAQPRLRPEQVAILLHTALRVEQNSSLVCLSPSSDVLQGIASIGLLNGFNVGQDLLTWQIGSHTFLADERTDEVASEVLTKLASDEADGVNAHAERYASAFPALESSGLIERVSGQWALRQGVVHKLLSCYQLDKPVPALSTENVSIRDSSLFGLLARLEEARWEWLPLPTSRRAKLKLQPYLAPNGVKKWYSSGVQPCLDYLRCLLLAEDWVASGVFNSIS